MRSSQTVEEELDLLVSFVRRTAASRTALFAAAVVGFGLALPLAMGNPATANEVRRTALSLIGTPQYPDDFQHFDWVNPNAPKGGRLRRFALGSFDSVNPFSIQGAPASGLILTHDTLMATSLDEPSTEYCLVCEWVSYPDDFSSATFKIRDGAKFSDGSPITPADIIFSMKALRKANPGLGAYYKNITEVKETGPNLVTFSFDQKNNRELPQIIGQLYVLSKAYWEGKDADGKPRDLSKSTLNVPVSSGAYRIKDVEPGRSISYERVKDYWAADLPVKRGQNNFDLIVFEFFRDATAGFEAFKAHKIDLWVTSSAKRWATEFDFRAARDNNVLRNAFPVERVAAMQAFVFNLRRSKFADPRLRQAFNYAFDFEWANKNLFFDQYVRLKSFFDNSELASRGLPAGRELEILNSVKDKVPPEVFTAEYANPSFGSPTDLRQNLRKALQLLQQAGWKRDGRKLVNAQGQTLEVEFLLVSPTFERIVLPYINNLKRLGIDARARVVDSAQYQRRVTNFDFDIVVGSFPQSLSPGNEQRDFWGTAAADKSGSRNLIGIKNPAIDTIIDRVIFAKDRPDLIAATRALDRVLLWNHYVVPQWHLPAQRLAWWDRYGRPDRLPRLTAAPTQVWWHDAEKAAALDTRLKK
ncbi:MAG: extracellular solute-binding protein [Pseudomonadota bacterium]